MNIGFCKAPLKYYKNIPDVLFKKSFKLGDNGERYCIYHAIDTSAKGKKVGIMSTKMQTLKPDCEPAFFPGFKTLKSLYICYIESHKHNLGNQFLKLATNESKKLGGQGRFHLISSCRYSQNKNKCPHIFYRKFGMNSLNEQAIVDIDRNIKGYLPFKFIDTNDITMYYSPKTVQQNKIKTVLNKLISLFII